MVFVGSSLLTASLMSDHRHVTLLDSSSSTPEVLTAAQEPQL